MTQTVTIMFTDIAGYTASVNSMQREDIRKLVERHEQIVTGFLRSKGGDVVKNLGDSYMVIFSSATEAVKAGMELLSTFGFTEQELQAMHEEGNSGLGADVTLRGRKKSDDFGGFDTIENDKTVPMSFDVNFSDLNCEFPEDVTQEVEARLPLRISCATGDVEKISGDYFGDSVNMSARILSKTPVGEFWFSYCTFMAMNQTEIPWEIVGKFAFKGFYGSQKVFRAIPYDRAYLPEIIEEEIADDEIEVFSANDTTPLMSSKSIWICLGCNNSVSIQNMLNRIPASVNRNKIWFVGYQVPPADRYTWQESGGNWLIGRDEIVEEILYNKMNNSKDNKHSETIVMSRVTKIRQLIKQGLALPRMPYGDLILGYKYFLNSNLQWNSNSSDAILHIEVSQNNITMQTYRNNIWHNQNSVPIEAKISLQHLDIFQIGKNTFQVLLLDSPEYCGIVTGGYQEIYPINTTGILIGRDPGSQGIVHPSPKNPGNMIWATGNSATNAKNSGFTLERALVGRKQVHIYEKEGQIYVQNLHDHCHAYVLEKNSSALHMLQDISEMKHQTMILVGRECFVISIDQKK